MMNIFACIKQVPDTTTRIKLRDDRNGIDESDIQWIISPHDELAIEEALRLREQQRDSTVTVLSAGPERVSDSLRMALAFFSSASCFSAIAMASPSPSASSSPLNSSQTLVPSHSTATINRQMSPTNLNRWELMPRNRLLVVVRRSAILRSITGERKPAEYLPCSGSSSTASSGEISLGTVAEGGGGAAA